MARRAFKKTVETYFPEDFHKVFYNLATMMAIYAMCFLWAPLPYAIWSVNIPWLKYSILGWSLVVDSYMYKECDNCNGIAEVMMC